MYKSRRVKLAVVVLAVLVAVTSSAKEVQIGQSSAKDSTAKVNLKLQVGLSFDNPEAYSSDPRVVRIRITNASNVPVPVSAIVGIDVSLTKYHNKVVGIGELFTSHFNAEDFEVVTPAGNLPKELKRNEQLEFKVNLSKGVWADVASSSIDLESKGFHNIDAGHYFLSAEVLVWTGGADAENRKSFESNEIEVKVL